MWSVGSASFIPMKRHAWLATVLLMLVGCTGEGPAPAPEPSKPTPAPIETYTARPAPDYVPEPEPEPTPSGQASSASGHLIAPAPELVASMTCEPVSESTRAAHDRHLPIKERAVQVLVGEGRESGSQWWIVTSAADEHGPDKSNAYGWGAVYLTDEPSLDSGSGSWINVSSERRAPSGEWRPTFFNVDWDDARIVRGQSAVVKARACRGLESYVHS